MLLRSFFFYEFSITIPAHWYSCWGEWTVKPIIFNHVYWQSDSLQVRQRVLTEKDCSCMCLVIHPSCVIWQKQSKRNGARDKRTEGDRVGGWGEIGREGSVQLCASLGFLLSTSSRLGQTGIIRFGKLPERPLWRSHGTLVCLFNCG